MRVLPSLLSKLHSPRSTATTVAGSVLIVHNDLAQSRNAQLYGYASSHITRALFDLYLYNGRSKNANNNEKDCKCCSRMNGRRDYHAGVP